APVSRCYPPLRGRLSTCYSPVRRFTQVFLPFLARLACVRHAASVDSEPGSNSQVNLQFDLSTLMTELLKIHQRLRTLSIVKELWLSGPKTVFLASKKPPASTWRISLEPSATRRSLSTSKDDRHQSY